MGALTQAAEEFIDAFNSHDESRIAEGYAANAIFEGPGGVRTEGREAAAQYAMTYIRAFPDVRLTPTNVLEAGDWVVIEFTYEGTHTAPLASPEGEIPPTNRRVTGRAVDILHLEGGKVVEEHLHFDQLEFLTQLGLVPEQATA